MRTLRTHFLNNPQIYKTGVLTRVLVFSSTFPVLLYLITGSLCLFDHLIQFPHSPASLRLLHQEPALGIFLNEGAIYLIL